jgi:ATP-dependent DNA helicase RecG
MKNCVMTNEELVELIDELQALPKETDIYNAQEEWSAKIVERATIDDIDPSAIAKTREKFKEGEHNIAVQAVDKKGLSGSDSLKIKVSGKT